MWSARSGSYRPGTGLWLSQSSRAGLGFAIISVDAGIAMGDDRRESIGFGERTPVESQPHTYCTQHSRSDYVLCTTQSQWQWPVSCLRLTGWACRISRFVTPDRISQKAAVELGHPADDPRYDGFCLGKLQGTRVQLPGRQGSAGGAEASSDGLPLCLSQKSAPWTNLS